ncbi:hypothetical protein SKAU_G00035810 [Synaphobranchus kaupii]|uniref:Uncharacterized protein n=1 Tax=Synaphobranchus kaupii TaxID=118154 RepID=A0A9Q1GG15_SYNKA|nr:hypothetical protein SKAU_G00035810 [Synaphobranchus kaupii]
MYTGNGPGAEFMWHLTVRGDICSTTTDQLEKTTPRQNEPQAAGNRMAGPAGLRLRRTGRAGRNADLLAGMLIRISDLPPWLFCGREYCSPVEHSHAENHHTAHHPSSRVTKETSHSQSLQGKIQMTALPPSH